MTKHIIISMALGSLIALPTASGWAEPGEAKQARKEAKEARKEANTARKEAKEARKEALKAKGTDAKEAREKAREAGEEARQARKEAREARREARKEVHAALKELRKDRRERRQNRRDAVKKRWGELVKHDSAKQELRKHARRMAHLNYMKKLAAEKENKDKLLARIDKLLEKEQARHEKRMEKIKANAPNAVVAGQAEEAPGKVEAKPASDTANAEPAAKGDEK